MSAAALASVNTDTAAEENAALEVRNMRMRFGGVVAVNNISFAVPQNSICALIGPNGAGKTTVFNCITGLYNPTGGEVWARKPSGGAAEKLNGKKPNHITARGLARTFQNIRLFSKMTALENVMMGRHCRTRAGAWGAIFRPAWARREEREIARDARKLLRRFGLAARENDLAGALPYAAQRRLEMARALATDPFLLLLDEPAAGMNPQETLDLEELLREIHGEYRLSLLLIEHDMRLVMRVSEKIVVMDHGEKLAEGAPAEVRANPRVVRAYLGEEQ